MKVKQSEIAQTVAIRLKTIKIQVFLIEARRADLHGEGVF